jgi:hypothetical protein
VDDSGQSLAPAAADPAALALKTEIRSARSEAKGAVARYDAQKDVESGHGLVSGTSDFMTSVSNRLFGEDAFKDPGDAVWDGTSAAQDAADSAEVALGAGDTETAAGYVEQARDAAGNASRLADGYGSGMVSGTGAAVTGLQAVKTGAEVTEVVLGTVVTGGAVGVAAAGGTATTAVPLVGAVSTATVATGIGLAQGIGEAAIPAAIKVAEGDTVDLAAVGADVLVQIALAKFGGRISGSLASAMTERLAGKFSSEILSKYLPGVIARVVLQEGSAVLKTAVQQVGETFRGQKITLDQFCDTLVANLLDWKGIAIAAITGGLEAQYRPSAGGTSGDGAELPDATADAVLLDASGEGPASASSAGGTSGDGADLPDATADAVLLDASGEGPASASSNTSPTAPAADVAQPAQAPSAAPQAAPGSSLPPPKILPASAASAANAELHQMTDADIQRSVDNWDTGESSTPPPAAAAPAAAPAATGGPAAPTAQDVSAAVEPAAQPTTSTPSAGATPSNGPSAPAT